MTAMMLSEELLLLAPDLESDPPGAPGALDHALAGALLLDLATEGLVVAKGKVIVGVAGTASHHLLTAALGELLAVDEPHAAQHWLTALPSALAPLRAQLGTSLAERGALAEQRRAALGLDLAAGWSAADPGPEHELRARLHRVLVYGGEPDARTTLLICLLRPLGLVRNVVDKQHRKQADARAKALIQTTANATATPAAVPHPVRTTQAAVLSAVLTAASVTAAT